MTGHVLTLGETMVSVTPSDIETFAAARAVELRVGGAESNVAVGLTRLGVPAVWASRVGRDPAGERILRELRAESVRLAVVEDPEAHTGMMVKERLASGQARVSYYRTGSAASLLTPDDIPDALLDDCLLLHVTGITLALSASAAATVRDVVARCVRRGIPVSFDLNHRPSLWADAARPRELYREVLRSATIAFAGRAEAELVVGGGELPELAERIASLGPREVLLKDGALGSYGRDGVSARHQASLPVRVVDSVGAGDAFAAGYLAARLASSPLATALSWAAAAGALACASRGDWESAGTRDDLRRALEGSDDIR